MINNLYDYNGIQVSGSHMVKEDGAWTRVEDSRLGKSLGDDEVIVYVFGSRKQKNNYQQHRIHRLLRIK